jgi:hypothetical protein
MQQSKELALRPLLCRGPFDPNAELTFLAGAEERDNRITPSPRLAVERRAKLLANRLLRRLFSTEGRPEDDTDKTRVN